jgi:hypothetical protein
VPTTTTTGFAGATQLERLTHTSYRVPEDNPTALSPSCGGGHQGDEKLSLRVRLTTNAWHGSLGPKSRLAAAARDLAAK